jgi:monofunctional biosynthetic peptidoglycan transglycosylase
MEKFKEYFKKAFLFLVKLLLVLFGLSIFSVIIFRFVPVPFTPLMVIRMWEQIMDDKKDFQFKKDWVSFDEISPNLPMAVISSEDQLFLDHNGFDVKAIEKAIKYNEKKKGKKVKGASTISQQTAKNVFLWPSRTYVRKGLEVYFTLLIELFWSKERIMEVYLNSIEMGEGIYGAQAASQFYFKKDANKLTQNEAALIAAILPNPRKWNAAKPTAYISGRKAWIVRQMNNLEGEIKFD